MFVPNTSASRWVAFVASDARVIPTTGIVDVQVIKQWTSITPHATGDCKVNIRNELISQGYARNAHSVQNGALSSPFHA
jgi:hypothetical protein